MSAASIDDSQGSRRRRRSELATPASNDWMFAKALSTNADLVFLDLEDATAESEKEGARHKVVTALTTLDWGNKLRAVRVNALSTEFLDRDLDVVVGEAGAHLDVLVVPKTRQVDEIIHLDRRLAEIERELGLDREIELEVLIETPQALQNVAAIASACPRVGALTLGGGDMSGEVGARYGIGYLPYDSTIDVWHAVRWQILVAARSAGIAAIDTPLPTYGDGNELFRRQAVTAYHMGFDGKWAIHPSQIDVANAAFGLSPEDERIAREVVEIYDAATKEGLGATSYHGHLLDVGNVNPVRHMLALLEAEPARDSL